jgi:hypothetical protein
MVHPKTGQNPKDRSFSVSRISDMLPVYQISERRTDGWLCSVQCALSQGDPGVTPSEAVAIKIPLP